MLELAQCAHGANCQLYMEDAVHVLFQCSFARQVWEAVGLHDLVSAWPNDTVIDLLKRVFSTCTKDKCMMVEPSCWSLWSISKKRVSKKVSLPVFPNTSRYS